LVVLDDPVVDHRDAPGAVEVGMRVPVRRRAVRRPARVSDPHASGTGRVGRERGLELPELPGALAHLHTAVDERDAGGVVASVFQTTKRSKDDRERLVGADVADDSAHALEGNSGGRPARELSRA
jgi:hypothetical protein